MERRLGFGAIVIACAILALPSVVEAQAWLDDRARTEGPGFRLGDFELHPGLGVELGYDSNLYYSDDDAMLPAVDTGILRATAHLMLATRGQQRRTEGEGGGEDSDGSRPTVAFRGGLSGSFYYFFADSDRTNMEVDASLALDILPGRTFSLSLYEEFGRSIRPFTENTDFAASYARLQNTAGVDLNFATTGEVLKITAGYRFGLDYFESEQFQYGNNFRHTISLTETFRFLPQTAIIHDTSFVIGDYWDSSAPLAPTLVNDGYLLRTRIGLNGAFTSNFSVLAMGGYAAGFFAEATTTTYDQEYESFVAQVEARWQIIPEARLVFGYERDFKPSFIGNWFRVDRGYANFQTLIARVFLLGVEASVGGYEFGRIVRPDGTPVGTTFNRSDVRLIATLFGEYRFTDWLGVNATLRYTGGFTDYEYRVPVGGGAPLIDPAGFNKFEAWLGVRVFY